MSATQKVVNEWSWQQPTEMSSVWKDLESSHEDDAIMFHMSADKRINNDPSDWDKSAADIDWKETFMIVILNSDHWSKSAWLWRSDGQKLVWSDGFPYGWSNTWLFGFNRFTETLMALREGLISEGGVYSWGRGLFLFVLISLFYIVYTYM